MLIHLERKEQFNEIIKNNPKVLVDFYATWCGPCRMLSPIIEKLANEIENVVFLKVDVDEFPEIAGLYNVRSIPTIIIFENGTKVKEHLGYMPENQIKNLL